METLAWRRGAALLLGLLAAACKRGPSADEVGSAPPPVASARPGVCAQGGGTPNDPVSAPFFPRVTSGYCIDPNGDARAYGEDAKGSLDDVCTQQLDGECEVYKSYGLRRLITLRYLDGEGSPGAVAITLSRFGSKEGAFGFYTKRVVADGDPLRTTLAELPAGAAAALGSGIAYVWRGEHLAELSYTNEAESPEAMRASGKRILPLLAREIGGRLPGDATPPPAVALLPAEHRLPMGVVYTLGDLLGISGLGSGAVGYYKDGDRRWRVFALGRADQDAAKDVLETLKKVDQAAIIKDLPFPARAFFNQHDDSAPRTEWVVGRKEARVLGVGDEELVLGGGHSKEEESHFKLTRDEKIGILKRVIAGG
jgi:hypothetical protein